MKRVYSTPSLWQARELMALLDQRRIPAVLANEHTAGTPGVLPFNAQMSVDAEVWVLEDADEAPARRLVDAYESREDGAPPWTCRCGEENPGSFELCWSCGSAPESASGSAPGSA